MKIDFFKTLESYCAAEAFSPLDLQFARFMAKLAGAESPELALAAAMVSRQTGTGHICLDLNEAAGKPLPQTSLFCPDFKGWAEALAKSPVVGSGADARPLVLDSAGRLYLYRYWLYEDELGKFLKQRAEAPVEPFDEGLLARMIKELFPDGAAGGLNRQKFAAYTAATKRFAVICGGPGTGKTTTVAKILALLIGLAGKPLQIALAAPTGKAADRLRQAITSAVSGLACADTLKAAIPLEAATLHRLLGFSLDEARVRYDENNLLPFHVVVVDEASMVDLPLMTKLARALSSQARLILLGDKDQLASVESGAVLGDICAGGRVESFSKELFEGYRRIAHESVGDIQSAAGTTALADCVVELTHNYRFGAESGIGALAAAVNAGNADRAIDILRSGQWKDLQWKEDATDTIDPAAGLSAHVMKRYGDLGRSADARQALALLGEFRILCAVREGPRGVEGVNSTVQQILEQHHRIRSVPRWYHGKPVMVTRNDYTVRLFNGDIGIVLHEPENRAVLKAHFPAPEGSVRFLAPARLPEHETVYAMSVHKSQGSEFDEVLIMLPGRLSPVLTRELIYTAITRARSKVTLWAGEEIFKAAVARRIERTSGLRDALKG